MSVRHYMVHYFCMRKKCAQIVKIDTYIDALHLYCVNINMVARIDCVLFATAYTSIVSQFKFDEIKYQWRRLQPNNSGL